MSSNVVKFRAQGRSCEARNSLIAVCEAEILRAHNEALAQICASLDRHVEIHRRMLSLMTESNRKCEALADLRLIALAGDLIRFCR